MNRHQNHLQGLLKPRLLDPTLCLILQFESDDGDIAFLSHYWAVFQECGWDRFTNASRSRVISVFRAVALDLWQSLSLTCIILRLLFRLIFPTRAKTPTPLPGLASVSHTVQSRSNAPCPSIPDKNAKSEQLALVKMKIKNPNTNVSDRWFPT